MAKGKANIGGYDKNAFYDCLGVNYLEKVLLDSMQIMPDFDKLDKHPNLDGSFEVCELETQKGVPESGKNILPGQSLVQWRMIPQYKFEVQIKTLNGSYANQNRSSKSVHSDFKYSCDTKAMNVVLGSKTLNPVLLMLVDRKNKHIYWKYLSQEYCLQLAIEDQDDKMIYFNRSDEIIDVQNWIRQLKDIYEQLVKKSHDEKEVRFMTNTAVEKKIPEDILNEMQEAFDYINGLYEHELKFVRDVLFPDVWKFGIAYVKNTKMGFSYMGIYKIKQGEDKTFFKSFEEDDNGGYIRKTYFGGKSLKEIVIDAIESHIELLFDKKEIVPPIMPDCVLLQIFYKEVDDALFQECSKKVRDSQEGKEIDIGWDKNSMSISEYEQLLNRGLVSVAAEACANELIRRGHTEFVRAFEDNKRHIIKIKGKKGKKSGRIIEYDPAYDRKALDKRNMVRFFDGISSVYKEGRKLIGNPDAMSLKAHYICCVPDDFSQVYFKTVEADTFQFEWKLASGIENADLPGLDRQVAGENDSSNRTWCLISPVDYSWNKLWHAMFKSMALKIIGRGKEVYILYREM